MPAALVERFIPGADGTLLFYERFGAGHPIVLCDGIACDGQLWKYLLREFSASFDIVRWNYPGHGRSRVPPKSADLSPERLADDLMQVLGDANFPGATLVAHSLGVQVALETWRRYPDRVHALVLVCGAPGRLFSSIGKHSLFRYLIPSLYVAEGFFPEAASNFFRHLPTQLMSRLILLTEEINLRLVRRRDLDAYFDGMRSVDFRTALRIARAGARHDATAYLHRIDVPVLILGGRLDRLIPFARLQAMADTIPGAEILISPRGSHALPIEQPDLVNLRIKQFLEERVYTTPAC